MHIQFCQERRISMDEKLLEIYKNSGVNKYVNVKLKDGRSIKCTADCFCTIGDDEDEDEDITALSVIHISGFREIITEDDVEKVII